MAEIHVGAKAPLGRLISEAAEVLETEKSVRLTGLNYSAGRVIDLAKALKHRVKNLHQKNEIESLTEEERNKTRFTITLSMTALSQGLGYQAPIPVGEVDEKTFEELKTRPPPRERAPREPRGDGPQRQDNRGGRGRGRGRGRGQGRERGGFSGEPRGPSKFQLYQEKLEKAGASPNEYLVTAEQISDQLEIVKKIVSDSNFQQLFIKAVGSNIHKGVTIAECARTEVTLSLFSKIEAVNEEETNFTVYMGCLSKANKKPDSSYF